MAGYLTPTQSAAKHSVIGRLLHWGTSGALIYGFIRNGEVTGALFDPAAMSREVMFSVALGVLFAIRFVWMRKQNNGASRLPASAPRWERLMSNGVHLGTYLSVAALILTGLAIAAAASNGGVLLFLAIGAHEIAVGFTIVLITLHIAGALWHWIIRRDGVWQSMLFGRR